MALLTLAVPAVVIAGGFALLDPAAGLVALGASASGLVAGVAGVRTIHAQHVTRLKGAMTALAAGEETTSTDAARLGRLAEAFEAAREAATTDRLTKVANRPTLLAQLFQEVERATRYGRPLTIAFIDLDHFKIINDTYGHAVGDEVPRDAREGEGATSRRTVATNQDRRVALPRRSRGRATLT